MWRDPKKGTYDPKNRFSDYAWFYKFLNWSFIWGAIRNFLSTLVCKIWIIEKVSVNAIGAVLISSIARRVNFHFWIVGGYTRSTHWEKILIKITVLAQYSCSIFTHTRTHTHTHKHTHKNTHTHTHTHTHTQRESELEKK